MIGAGFNLLVNRTEEEDESDAIDPLDWLNCAADKANAVEDEVRGKRPCTTVQNFLTGSILLNTRR